MIAVDRRIPGEDRVAAPIRDGGTPDYERLADQRIVEKLRSCGFDGPEWRVLACALMEYGYTVLVVWACKGTLGQHAARHRGLGGARVPINLQLDADEAHALATEVVLVAREKFRTRSLPRWRPTGGASLRSYFIGRCLMELGDVYRVWYAREVRPLPIDHTRIDDGRYGARPDEEAVAMVLTDRMLDRDPDLCRALQLQAQGYKLEEIAEEMGSTADGVRSQIYRGRQRYKKEDPR
jgi:hypothetical protein